MDSKNDRLRKAAFDRHVMKTKVIQNQKMNAYIEELRDCEEFKEVERFLPIETRSENTIIAFFTKDIREKNWANLEFCDVVIYDRDFCEFFVVKTKGKGITELLVNEVSTRGNISDGGYFVRVREKCIIDLEEDVLCLRKNNVDIEREFSDEEIDSYIEAHKTDRLFQ